MKAAIIAVIALMLVGTAQAREWPTFKHDSQRTGYSDSLIPTPSADEIAWTFNADDSLSSPAVDNYKVFVGSRGGYLYAINVFTGKELWRFKADDAVSSPTVSDGYVYFGSSDGYIYSLYASNGTLHRKENLGEKITSTPAVHRDLLLVCTWRGTVYTLNRGDLSENWRYQTGEPGMLENYPIVSSPAVWGGRVYIGSNDWHLYALHENGEFDWKFPAGYQIGSSPAVVDNVVYFGSGDNYLYALDAENGELRWKFHAGDRVQSSPSVADGRVYFGSLDHSIYSLNPENGDNWSYATGGPIYSSPAVADNRVFITSQDGYLYVIRARDGVLVWKHNIGATGEASPAIAYGKIFIGADDGRLYCFGSWGSVPGGNIGRGVVYLLIAALLFLALWGLTHLKPLKPSRVRKKK